MICYEKKIVSVIGSCRVHTPINKIALNGLLQTNNAGFLSFCHSSKEVCQKLRFANGRVGYPDYIRPFINGTLKDGDHPLSARADFSKSDCFIIEVSSKKHLSFGDFSLQMNFFKEYFVKKNSLNEWWLSLVQKANTTSGKVFMPLKGVPNEIASIVNNVGLEVESEDSIDKDIRIIRNYINKPIIIVGHFDVPREDGKPLKERKALNKALKRSAEKYDMKYFEPSELISQYGDKKALRPHSTNHWNHEFEETVGRYIYDRFIL